MASLELLDLNISLSDLRLKVSNSVALLFPFLAQFLLGGWAFFLLLYVGFEVIGSRGRRETTLERHQSGCNGFTGEPLVGGSGGLGGGGRGEDIVLENVLASLTGYLEGDGLHGAGVGTELQETHDLAFGDLDANLRVHAHTSGGYVRGVLRQEVNLGAVIGDFVVTNVTVTLASKEQNASVVIIEGHEKTSGGINVLLMEGLGEICGIPQSDLTITGTAETSTEHLAGGTKEASTGTLNTFVGNDLTNNGLLTRIDDAHFLVLASGYDERTIVVPGDGLNDVSVALDIEERLALFGIPDLHGVIRGGGSQDVVCARVPVYGTDLTTVASESLDRVADGIGDTTFRNVPQLNSAVLRGGGDDVIVERVELNIEHGGLVARDEGIIALQFTMLFQGHDNERTSTDGIPDGSEEFGVGSDVVAVPNYVGQFNALVAFLSLVGLTKHVSVLG